MDKYRVGRIIQPWVNFTPPIRGGTFRKAPDLTNVHSDASAASICNLGHFSNKGGDQTVLAVELASQIQQAPAAEYASSVDSDDDSSFQDDTFSEASSKSVYSSAADYISDAVQAEIDSNLRDFPSLDAKTQDEINLKYSALHERVFDEGFYNCHYSQYAKEACRYAALFMIFLAALHKGWYLTSACFLGLFWVCTRPFFDC